MKKKLIKMLLLVVVIFSVSSAVSAQIYVQIRPAAPVIIRTPPPSNNHVWINEEWEPNNDGGYRYVGGHWEARPREGYEWREGYWKHNNRGDVWRKGNWRKGNWRKERRD